jgi:Domain of unknown function (DUF1905)
MGMSTLDAQFTATLEKSPSTGGFMRSGDGRHKLPLKADVRKSVGDQAGDTATAHLDERLV